jgi:hypothetical protein
MRFPKTAILVVAALTLGATFLYVAVGLGSVKEVNTCSAKQTVCEKGKLLADYKGGELVITAKATKPTFSGKLAVTCKESVATALATGLNAVTVEKLTFSGCETCTSVTASKLPAKGEGFATSEGNGELRVPLTLTFSGCPAEAKCVFSKSEAVLSGLGSTTEPSTSATKVSLSKTEGAESCGTTSEFNAKYVLTEAVERLLEVEDVTFERKLPLSGFIESEHE